MNTNTKRQWLKRCQHKDTAYRGEELRLLERSLKRRFRRQGKQELHASIMAKAAVWFY